MELKAVEFSPEHLSWTQTFECGTSEWAKLAADWIKNAPPFPSALQSIQIHGTTVWLHFLEVEKLSEEYLVGFSSLGTTRWSIPPPDGPKREAGFIPMLAVALAFQGRPEGGQPKPYSHLIMEHIITEGGKRGYRELCLFVHEDNVRAFCLYQRFDFQVIGERDERGMLRMLKLLY